ncbi:MAG: transglutaminase-like cysteine peptidase [Rhodoferax sp.]
MASLVVRAFKTGPCVEKCTKCYNSFSQGFKKAVCCRFCHDRFFALLTSALLAPRAMTRVLGLLACACGVWIAQAAYGGVDFDSLLAALTQRWGAVASPRFKAWQSMVIANKATTDTERLKKTNDFFNRQIVFGDDWTVWGQEDYWATPLETLGKGAGDCEDFVIAKYFTLKQMGIESVKLRLIYVRAKTGSSDSTASQAHMVLAYYAKPESEPMVLDNLIGDIRPASRRPDLVPVFSFSSEGIFTGVSGTEAKPVAGTGRLSRWEDLLKRARAEGFE